MGRPRLGSVKDDLLFHFTALFLSRTFDLEFNFGLPLYIFWFIYDLLNLIIHLLDLYFCFVSL